MSAPEISEAAVEAAARVGGKNFEIAETMLRAALPIIHAERDREVEDRLRLYAEVVVRRLQEQSMGRTLVRAVKGALDAVINNALEADRG